jgi:hypothetical protein
VGLGRDWVVDSGLVCYGWIDCERIGLEAGASAEVGS